MIEKIDDYENIYSVSSLYLITGKVDRHIEQKDGNKYLCVERLHEN